MTSARPSIFLFTFWLWLAMIAPCSAQTAKKVPATVSAGATNTATYAQRLGRECDLLLDAAVKRPYGWGWTPMLEAGAKENKGEKKVDRSPLVSFEPGQSPAAGLLLLWAGDQLHEPRYQEAALQAARGVARAQQEVGKFPSQPFFGMAANGREPPMEIADRASTRAAMGLLLSVLNAQGGGPDQAAGKRDDELDRAAHRAAAWMRKQQSPPGPWPVGYPPGAEPLDTTRLVRLDTPDTRDSTFAMLLSYDVLGQPEDRVSVERSIDALLRCRLLDLSKPGAKLWSCAYNIDGSLNNNFPELPSRIDVLASRYGMQTLLGAYLSLGLPPAGDALDDAARNLASLPREREQWCRRYDLRYAYFHDPTSRPTADLFPRPTTQKASDAEAAVGTFGLDPVLAAVQSLHDQGRQAYRTSLNVFLTYQQHLAATITGLEDQPMTNDFPQRPEDVDAYLHRHEEDWKSLTGPPPPELSARVHRLWLLLIRAKIEQRFGI